MKWHHVVKFLHVLIVLFMVVAPFSGKCDYILLHSVMVPFLFLHWATNNDTCALTEIEKFIAGKSDNEATFVGSVVSPVFKIESNEIKIITLFLWVFSLTFALRCNSAAKRKFFYPLRILLPKRIFKIL